MDTIAATQSNDVKMLEQLNEAFIASLRTSDVAWFERHLSDDFLNTNTDGSFVDRKAFLALITPPLPLADFACEDVLIRILGDVALIHARSKYRKPGGAPGAWRYSDIWQRRDGRWVCVGAQVMRG
jgi:ketosteroid isomerase-like protein